MIPMIYGMDAAREKIAGQRALTEKTVSPETAARIEELFGQALTPEQAVAKILEDVRVRGDDGVRAWAEKLDGAGRGDFLVSAQEIETAYQETPDAVREALHLAADRIGAFHEKQKPRSWLDWTPEGGALGQILQPLERVGVYVPGGAVPLPSSLLMSVIPARVAGVSEIIVMSPPSRGGKIAPVILAAARVANVSRVYALGGAQAIAALAFGTHNIPRVDKILGAGGLFTTLAKRQVFGLVGIDGLYGPTETVLIADDAANPKSAAADLLAQAEHDVLATSILLTPSRAFAERVAREIEAQLPDLSRRAIIEQALQGQSAIFVLDSLDECLEIANAYAPEHLCLLTRDAWAFVPRVRNAGGIFVGEQSSEALGDYMLGPSHVMPTGGTARFASPLNVNDFVKITSVFYASEQEAQQLSAPGQILATGEELTAHANALKVRAEGKFANSVRTEMREIRGLLRSDLEALPDYTPAHVADPRRVIKLDSNENPYGASPRVLAALADTQTWHYYFGQEELREALAQYAGVKAENIVVTNGGDESIDLILRAVLEPNDIVIDAPPSFEMYRIAALANRGKVIDVSRLDDFSLDVQAVMRASQTPNVKALCLASPNNPDGGILPRADLLRLLELPALVMLDEAYFEFAGMSAVDLISRYSNLVIVRTFSKWAGLAGLRVGYVIASPEFANALHKLRAPYNVNWAGLVAARESLNDAEYLMNNVRATIAERERLRGELAKWGWLEPLPSCTNFLLLRVRGRDPQQVKQALARQAILIRAFKSARLREYLRISVGLPAQNEQVLTALQKL